MARAINALIESNASQSCFEACHMKGAVHKETACDDMVTLHAAKERVLNATACTSQQAQLDSKAATCPATVLLMWF